MKIVDNIIFLRNIQSVELVSYDTSNFTFYVKQDSEQYISMQNAELEKEKIERCVYKIKVDQKKLQIDQKKLEQDTISFNNMKNKFLKLFENGRVKIIT